MPLTHPVASATLRQASEILAGDVPSGELGFQGRPPGIVLAHSKYVYTLTRNILEPGFQDAFHCRTQRRARLCARLPIFWRVMYPVASQTRWRAPVSQASKTLALDAPSSKRDPSPGSRDSGWRCTQRRARLPRYASWNRFCAFQMCSSAPQEHPNDIPNVSAPCANSLSQFTKNKFRGRA